MLGSRSTICDLFKSIHENTDEIPSIHRNGFDKELTQHTIKSEKARRSYLD